MFTSGYFTVKPCQKLTKIYDTWGELKYPVADSPNPLHKGTIWGDADGSRREESPLNKSLNFNESP